MKAILFGSTGRTGARIARALVDAGHGVFAVVRPGSTNDGTGDTLAVDLTDAAAIRSAVSGADAVVSALASGKGNPACSWLTASLLPLSGLRYLTIGGAGVDSPGDNKGFGDRAVGAIMRLTVGAMLADRQREHELLLGSDLRWTMLRPPRLTDKPGTGTWRLSDDRPGSAQISRDDLAAAAVALLTDPSSERRAPFVFA